MYIKLYEPTHLYSQPSHYPWKSKERNHYRTDVPNVPVMGLKQKTDEILTKLEKQRSKNTE